LSDGTFTKLCREHVLANLENIQQKIGQKPLRRLTFLKRIPQGDTMIYLYRATFKAPVIALMSLTADKKVADLQLLEPPAG
jgi:hypothetical protein